MSDRLRIENLEVHYPVRKGVFRRVVGAVRAVDGVSLSIPTGATFGLVGESGCGKSSLARAILQLQKPTGGSILFKAEGKEDAVTDLTALSPRKLRALRREMQIVFQDPYSAINPRLRVKTILNEPLRAMESLSATERSDRIAQSLRAVGLTEAALERFPHQFSGGQRQRIAIARALLSRPNFIVLDEPVSALDVSVRAQILNLLIQLQRQLGLTYLFVSHDLSVVRYLCDQVAVMYLGRIVESGPTERIFSNPLHPYTKLLLAAVPMPRPRRGRKAVKLQGDPPSPMNIPSGCPFHTRCLYATEMCRTTKPLLRDLEALHGVACHYAESLAQPRHGGSITANAQIMTMSHASF
ncbi:ABC transporter ATP-binding protein [Microvirga sp. 2YAF29]|uniref:ABC transporter ATP-binding protein n=1 Tax=Microvirga sp. 2YAF29 TaxID=3233031 RepID=UPI003F96A0FD